jgi:[NiFe] hydrogenase assembly HybE family chaperone
MTTGCTDHPGERLQAVFGRIATTRMAGVPLVNPALAVEAIGFRRWQLGAACAEVGDGPLWLGILLTPWFMNLLLLPAAVDALPAVPPGGSVPIALPGGTLPFLAGSEDGIGDYRMCSLFSPLQQFADQDGARATAVEMLRLLFPAPAADTPDLSRRRLFGLSP